MMITMYSFLLRPGNWHSTPETVLRWCGGYVRQGEWTVDWRNRSSRVDQC